MPVPGATAALTPKQRKALAHQRRADCVVDAVRATSAVPSSAESVASSRSTAAAKAHAAPPRHTAKTGAPMSVKRALALLAEQRGQRLIDQELHHVRATTESSPPRVTSAFIAATAQITAALRHCDRTTGDASRGDDADAEKVAAAFKALNVTHGTTNEPRGELPLCGGERVLQLCVAPNVLGGTLAQYILARFAPGGIATAPWVKRGDTRSVQAHAKVRCTTKVEFAVALFGGADPTGADVLRVDGTVVSVTLPVHDPRQLCVASLTAKSVRPHLESQPLFLLDLPLPKSAVTAVAARNITRAETADQMLLTLRHYAKAVWAGADSRYPQECSGSWVHTTWLRPEFIRALAHVCGDDAHHFAHALLNGPFYFEHFRTEVVPLMEPLIQCGVSIAHTAFSCGLGYGATPRLGREATAALITAWKERRIDVGLSADGVRARVPREYHDLC